MNGLRPTLAVSDEPQRRHDAARRVLAEIAALTGEALGGALAGDPFEIAVLRAARPWLVGWADHLDRALEVVRRRERFLEAELADAPEPNAQDVVVPYPFARLDAGVQLRRIRRLLSEAHAYALEPAFAACDYCGVGEMTANLVSFLDAVAELGAADAPSAAASF